MTTMRAWKFRPGSDDKTIQSVLKMGKVRLDYEVPGLRPDMTREDLINAIRTHNPDRSDKGFGRGRVSSSPCLGTWQRETSRSFLGIRGKP